MNIYSRLAIASCLIILGFMVVSCNNATTTTTEEGTTQASSEDSSERKLDKDQFASRMKKSGAVLVDVRMPGEFEQGHIEGAINIDFFSADFKHDLLDLNRNKKYYLYCKNEVRSYRAMKFMETNDFKNVYMLKGGYEEWTKPATE